MKLETENKIDTAYGFFITIPSDLHVLKNFLKKCKTSNKYEVAFKYKDQMKTMTFTELLNLLEFKE